MKIPKQINILGLTYAVEEVEVVSKGELLLGQINYLEQTIRIDKSLSEDRKGQVFMHELLHGILEGLGMAELNENENALQSIAAAMYHILSGQAISFRE